MFELDNPPFDIVVDISCPYGLLLEVSWMLVEFIALEKMYLPSYIEVYIILLF